MHRMKPGYSLPHRADRLEDYDEVHTPDTNRLMRLETKLSKLLKHFGLDPVTGDPVQALPQRIPHRNEE